MPNLYFGTVFVQLACRITLGPPKHVLHLVWSCLNIYLALITTLKVPFKLALLCWLFWPTMTKNNKGNLFVFEVGPSVKFVSAIKDAMFNKKNGGKFFWLKKCQTGGSEGSLATDHIFSGFSFVHPSLISIISYTAIVMHRLTLVFSCLKEESTPAIYCFSAKNCNLPCKSAKPFPFCDLALSRFLGSTIWREFTTY